MATDATGTPSANRNYPKYLTSADAPSGVGLNNIVDAIDQDVQNLADNAVSVSGSPVEGDALVWDATTSSWKPASSQPMAVGGLEAGTDGQVLVTNGSAVEWGAVDIETDTRYRLTSTVTVVSTGAETDIVSQSIGAGVMGTDKLLRCTLFGKWVSNVDDTGIQLRVYLGGTTILASTGGAGPVSFSGTEQPFAYEVWIANLGAANSQAAGGFLVYPSAGGSDAMSTGIGSMILNSSGVANVATFYSESLAVDTSSAQTFRVTATPITASASVSITKKYAAIEIV